MGLIAGLSIASGKLEKSYAMLLDLRVTSRQLSSAPVRCERMPVSSTYCPPPDPMPSLLLPSPRLL